MNALVYTKKKFGLDLISLLNEYFDINKISKWASDIYINNIDDIKDEFKDIVQQVAFINCGPEFELTKDQLLEIAIECVSPLKDLQNLAKDILGHRINAIDGVWELLIIMQPRQNNELESIIEFVTSDNDEIVLSPNKLLYSKEFLERQDKWKEGYVKKFWPKITEICETILR